MKKSATDNRNFTLRKMPFRHEAIRVLTTHELTLVVAGNCLYGSGVSHSVPNLAGVC